MKTLGSRIVFLTIVGVFYYSADQTLASVEATVDASAMTNNVLARRRPKKILGTGETQTGIQNTHIMHDIGVDITDENQENIQIQ